MFPVWRNLNDPKNASEFVKSRQIGELDKLPDLGASAKPGAHQANPLMDNYEGLVITNRRPARHSRCLVASR